jgi:hypothetical protein
MKSTTFRLLAGCGAVALVSLLAIPNVQARSSVISSTTFGGTFKLGGAVGLDVEATTCDNTGSEITISGALTIETGTKVRVTFKNNVKGTKTFSQVGDAVIVVLPIGEEDISIAKQPVNGGVGGNPWFSFGLNDSEGEELSSQVVLGRCVQGVSARIDERFDLASGVLGIAEATECSSRRSVVNFLTESNTLGVDGLLLLDNNINKVVHRAQAGASATLQVAGVSSVRKGWGAGGAGGNPLVFVDIVDDDEVTSLIGGEINLGRCNKLGS